jgi:competence protein ComEC
MILAPLLQRYFFGEKKPGTVRQILFETIAASICTLPVLLVAFGQFSNVALFANLLILPLVPLAMLLTFVAGVAMICFPFTSHFVGLPAAWILQYMIEVARYLAGLPWAQSQLSMTVYGAAACYGAIIAFCLYVWRVTKFDLRNSNVVE